MRDQNDLHTKDIGGVFHVCSQCYVRVPSLAYFWEDEPRLFFCSEAHAKEWDRKNTKTVDVVRKATKKLFGWLRK